MPLKRCGDGGWKWGDEGKCYTGPDGKKKAIKQGVAIEGPQKFSQKAYENKFPLSESDIDFILECAFEYDISINDGLICHSYLLSIEADLDEPDLYYNDEEEEECDCEYSEDEDCDCGDAMAAEYQGRKVTLNKPFRTPNGPKKFAVYTKNESGNVVIVRFGDPDMKIKKNDPERRKSFRARHNCDNPGPKWSARYWSCRAW